MRATILWPVLSLACLLAPLSACMVDTPAVLGRVCDERVGCGPGAVCDLQRRVCVAEDAGAIDGKTEGLQPDGPVPDGPAVDQQPTLDVVPDSVIDGPSDGPTDPTKDSSPADASAPDLLGDASQP